MPSADYEEQKAVARANRAFYRAFESQDLAGMSGLWDDDPGVQCIHPGGETLVGRERVLASWEAIFTHSEPLRFELVDVELRVEGELAWVSLVERIAGPEDEPAAEAACTNLFALRDGAWRMLLHHASPIQRRFFDA